MVPRVGCHARPVKSLRFSLVVGLAVLTGCQSLPFTAPHYTHFRVTNYRGELIADWTAEGDYGRVGPAYKIKAVERIVGRLTPRRLIIRTVGGRLWTARILCIGARRSRSGWSRWIAIRRGGAAPGGGVLAFP